MIYDNCKHNFSLKNIKIFIQLIFICWKKRNTYIPYTNNGVIQNTTAVNVNEFKLL